MLFSLRLDCFDHGARGWAPLSCDAALPPAAWSQQRPVGGGQPVVVLGLQKRQWLRTSLFHLGRIAAYALLGGIAAVAMESLAWLTSQTTALQRLWTLMHVAVAGLGTGHGGATTSQPGWSGRGVPSGPGFSPGSPRRAAVWQQALPGH